MKNKFLLSGIILWSLVFLVLAGFLTVFLAGDADMSFPNMPWSSSNAILLRDDVFPLNDLVNLKVQGRAEDIIVRLSSDDTIRVRQYGDERRSVVFEDRRTDADGGTALTLSVPGKKGFTLFNWGSGHRLEIDLPSQYAHDLDLVSVSGEIDLPEGFEGRALTLSSTSGGLVLGMSVVESATLSTTSGDIRTKGIQAENATLKSVSGCISAGTLTIENQVDLNASSGDIHVNTLLCQMFDIKTISGQIGIITSLSGGGVLRSTSGDILASGVEVNRAVSVDTVSGDVILSLVSGQNCDLKLSSISGDFHGDVPLSYANSHKSEATGTLGSGGHLVTVSTTSGEVFVNIE